MLDLGRGKHLSLISNEGREAANHLAFSIQGDSITRSYLTCPFYIHIGSSVSDDETSGSSCEYCGTDNLGLGSLFKENCLRYSIFVGINVGITLLGHIYNALPYFGVTHKGQDCLSWCLELAVCINIVRKHSDSNFCVLVALHRIDFNPVFRYVGYPFAVGEDIDDLRLRVLCGEDNAGLLCLDSRCHRTLLLLAAGSKHKTCCESQSRIYELILFHNCN